MTPRSFSGEMFHLDPFSLLRTGRRLRILVRNKKKTNQTVTETGPARREVAPGPPRQAARCRPGRTPRAVPRQRRPARYSPSGPPRRGDPAAPDAAPPRRRHAPTSARSGSWRGAMPLGGGGRGQRDRREWQRGGGFTRHRRLENNGQAPVAVPTGPATGPAAAPCPRGGKKRLFPKQ